MRDQYSKIRFTICYGLGGNYRVGCRFLAVCRAGEIREPKSFSPGGSERMIAIERRIQSSLDSVLSVKYFFESNFRVERAQFSSFTSPLLKRDNALKALEWIPNVSSAQRSQYENAPKVDGFENFRFTERSKKGKLITAGQREDYFPVFLLNR